MEKQTDIRELAARLKALGVILKICREMNDAADFSAAAAIAANSPEVLLHFKSAALLEKENKKTVIVGQYGLYEPNVHSDCAVNYCRLAPAFAELESGKSMVIRAGDENEGFSADVRDALAAQMQGQGELLVIRLPQPGFVENTETVFYWLLEFPGAVPGYASTAVNLCAASFGAALYAHKYCRNTSTSARIRRHISRSRFFLAAAVVLLAVMFIPVREQINAEFVLRAPEITGAYALFDGPVANCFKQDGDRVESGDVIVEYDTSQLRFRLDSAINRLSEIQKEYDLENSASFSDRNRLGRVPLLAARLESARVDVKEARWYLDHSRIKAPASGILALADGRAELLKNRVLRTGDRIFDIYGGKGMIAEIRVNERDSSILLGKISTSLFLYTQPETEIAGAIIDIRQYPERTEQNTWCYKVLAELKTGTALRYGMRGVAKLRGSRVTLGYLLFKNAVLYFRWL